MTESARELQDIPVFCLTVEISAGVVWDVTLTSVWKKLSGILQFNHAESEKVPKEGAGNGLVWSLCAQLIDYCLQPSLWWQTAPYSSVETENSD